MKNILESDNFKKIIAKFSTLDSFVQQNDIKQLDILKCDVEGAEKFVFEGGMDTLQKYKPIIYCEMLRKWAKKFNYHPNDIIEMLKPLGYQCYEVSAQGFALIESVTDETEATNFIFKI